MHFPRLLAMVSLAALSVQPALAAVHDLPSASAESEGMSTGDSTRLNSGMKELVDQGRLAGSVTMVARHGKVVEFDAAGKRDIASNAPMQKDSIFRIYSMSKPITGVAMMMLFEEGKWQLNDPVAKYIPEFAKLKVYGTDANNNVVMKDQVHPVTMRAIRCRIPAASPYGFFSNTAVDKLQLEADLLNPNNTLDEFIKPRVAKLPLSMRSRAPNGTTAFRSTSRATSSKSSPACPSKKYSWKKRHFPAAHGMVDTGFYVPKERSSIVSRNSIATTKTENFRRSA